MIQQLYNRHQGRTIAIVASGPTATAFNPHDSDYSIGVNGAALLAHRGLRLDYFLCGSQHAPRRPWFTVDCASTRIICVRFALHDRSLYPDALYPGLIRRSYVDDDIDTITLPPPVAPHLTYRYTREPTATFLTGRRPFDKVVIGGTIAAVAVQIAYLMGATCLKLYGCSFSRQTSHLPQHYFYRTAADHGGGIDDSQLAAMERTLAVVRQHGVEIQVVGATALRQYDRQLPTPFAAGNLTMARNPILHHLGFADEQRVVILHADDLGMCQATVQAFAAIVASGLACSGSVMTPCPAFPQMAAYCRAHPDVDMGVHLTLTSEYATYRWGPLSTSDPASGLLDAAGYLPRRPEELTCEPTRQR